MNLYEINEDTLAIIPFKNKTIIHENKKTIELNNKANDVIKYSCEYFGSSLDGRKKGTTSMIGITHKVPIVIEESKELIFFPTNSPRLESCSWISFNNIAKYYRYNNGTMIEFKSGKKILSDLSFGIIDNQVMRATRLNLVLRDRKVKKD